MAGEWADLVDFLKNDISRLEEKEMRNNLHRAKLFCSDTDA